VLTNAAFRCLLIADGKETGHGERPQAFRRLPDATEVNFASHVLAHERYRDLARSSRRVGPFGPAGREGAAMQLPHLTSPTLALSTRQLTRFWVLPTADFSGAATVRSAINSGH